MVSRYLTAASNRLYKILYSRFHRGKLLRYFAKTILLLILLPGFTTSAIGRIKSPLNEIPAEEGKIRTEFDASQHAMLVHLEPMFLFYEKVPAGQIIKTG